MAFIDQKHIPATGNVAIDAAHMRIAGEVNQLYVDWQIGGDLEQFRSRLVSMVEEVERHFRLETLIAKGAGIPNWESHAKEHDRIISVFRTILMHFKKAPAESMMSFFDAMSNLIYEHEILEDYYLRAFLSDTSPIARGEDFIAWQDELLTGNTQIDHEHQSMVDLLNALYDSVAKDESNEYLQNRLKVIKRLTHDHFAHEEEVMRQRQDPDYSLHKDAHQALIDALDEMIALSATGGPLGSRLILMKNLRHWFIDHVVHLDRPAERRLQAQKQSS